MSCTVRLWSEAELVSAKAGTDLWLTTLLLNKGTFSDAEIKAYPYNLRKSYLVEFDTGAEDSHKFYAPNDEMALRFVQTQWMPGHVIGIQEICTTYREVPIPVPA